MTSRICFVRRKGPLMNKLIALGLPLGSVFVRGTTREASFPNSATRGQYAPQGVGGSRGITGYEPTQRRTEERGGAGQYATRADTTVARSYPEMMAFPNVLRPTPADPGLSVFRRHFPRRSLFGGSPPFTLEGQPPRVGRNKLVDLVRAPGTGSVRANLRRAVQQRFGDLP